MHDLNELIYKWQQSALELREAETLTNLLIIDNKRLEREVRQPKTTMDVIASLQEVADTATMERFSCDFTRVRIDVTPTKDEKTLMHPNEYIKEKTDLFRRSWIINPLNEVIKHLKGCDG